MPPFEETSRTFSFLAHVWAPRSQLAYLQVRPFCFSGIPTSVSTWLHSILNSSQQGMHDGVHGECGRSLSYGHWWGSRQYVGRSRLGLEPWKGHLSGTNFHQSGPTTYNNSSMCLRLDVQTLVAMGGIRDKIITVFLVLTQRWTTEKTLFSKYINESIDRLSWKAQ